jgi:rRNA maturation endonuclease Nob1
MWDLETDVVGMKYHHKQLKFSVDENFKWESEDDNRVGYRLENEITLRREPDNKYDKHAVQVLMDGNLIGYISKETARKISKEMDKGIIFEIADPPFLQMEGGQVERLTLRLRANEEGVKKVKKVKDDVSERILCSDGNCVGTINEKGVCNICGKPLKRGEKSREQERTKDSISLLKLTEGRTRIVDVVDESHSERISCSDGSCVGVINEKGVCNICGKPDRK